MDIKLAIALPCGDYAPQTKFWDCFNRMAKPFPWTYLRPDYPQEFYSGIADIRNELVRQAFESDCTHILMLDTDQTPPPDLIPRLFSHRLPIVCARVHRRYPPYDPILKRRVTGMRIDGKQGFEDVPLDEWIQGGLVRVDRTGIAACGLFDISVFENIAFPWFETIKETLPTLGEHTVGEDISFCDKARAAGYEICVDSGLEVGHLMTIAVGKDFYLMFKKLRELAA